MSKRKSKSGPTTCPGRLRNFFQSNTQIQESNGNTPQDRARLENVTVSMQTYALCTVLCIQSESHFPELVEPSEVPSPSQRDWTISEKREDQELWEKDDTRVNRSVFSSLRRPDTDRYLSQKGLISTC